jgi:hypothetical protein
VPLRGLGAERNVEAEFPKDASQAVESLRAGVLPLLSCAMESLNSLLLDGVDGDGLDVVTAMGLEQGLGVDAVGLSAAARGLGVLGGKQAHVVAECLRGSAPEVGGAAGFEQHQRGD